MFRSDELADIDRQLQNGTPVVVHGPIGGGKSTLLRAYARYALLTRWFDEVVLATDAEQLRGEVHDENRAVLHIWDDIDVDACAAAVKKLPAGHRVLIALRYDSFPLKHHSHFTGDLPNEQVADVLRRALWDEAREFMLQESEFSWLIRAIGWHSGTLAAVQRAWRTLPLPDLASRLDLGYTN